MADATPDSSQNAPAKAGKLDQIANQHRENLRAEARSIEGAHSPDLDGAAPRIGGQRRRSDEQLGQRSFAQQERTGLDYHTLAIRGDYGEAEKARALDAYNRGEQLDGPPQVQAEQTDEERAAERGLTLEADRPDGSQHSTRVTSTDQQSLQSGGVVSPNPASTDQQAIAARMATGDQAAPNVAPGAADAKVVENAPVTGQGKQSSTATTTIKTTPPSTPAKK